MSSLNPQPDTPASDELLVAYLDGELSSEESRQIEQRLAVDEGLRDRLRELDQAWEALDALPPATLRDDFARTTIEMVSVAAEKDVSKRQAATNARDRRNTVVAVLAGLAAAAIGFVTIRALPDSNRRLVEDLPVIMQVDLLTQVPDVEFLRRLSSTATIEQLANDEERLDRDMARVTLVSDQSPHQRAPEIEQLSPEEKAALTAQSDRFWDRSEAEQQRLRALEREIATDPDSDRLQRTLLAYGQWLNRRGSGVRAELRSEGLDTDQRLRRIAYLIKEDDRQAARKLSPDDAKRLREEIFTIAEERKPDWFDEDRSRKDRKEKVRKDRWAFLIVVKELHDHDTDDQTRERLTNVLSKPAQEHLKKMRWQKEQRNQLLKWMWDSMRPERGPEALETFFAEKLSNDQRARLLNLPPGQMEAELERLYFADQLGDRGREWLGGFGSPPWAGGGHGRERSRHDGRPRGDGLDRGPNDRDRSDRVPDGPQRPRPDDPRHEGHPPGGPPPQLPSHRPPPQESPEAERAI